MIVGVAAVFAPWHFLTASTVHVTDASVALSQQVMGDVVGYVTRTHAHQLGKGSRGYALVVALGAALVPVLCSIVLLFFAKLALHARWAVAAAAVVIGTMGVVMLHGGAAWSIAIFAGLVVVAVLAGSHLLSARLAFVGAFLAAGLVRSLTMGQAGSGLRGSSATLAQLTHTPGGLWVGALSGLVILLVFCAFVVTLHQPSTGS
jgi:hypothetical protein